MYILFSLVLLLTMVEGFAKLTIGSTTKFSKANDCMTWVDIGKDKACLQRFLSQSVVQLGELRLKYDYKLNRVSAVMGLRLTVTIEPTAAGTDKLIGIIDKLLNHNPDHGSLEVMIVGAYLVLKESGESVWSAEISPFKIVKSENALAMVQNKLERTFVVKNN